jgi:hypothetical protein
LREALIPPLIDVVSIPANKKSPPGRCTLLSSVRKHHFDSFLIALGNKRIDIQESLSFCGLAGENVPGVRMPALDISSGRDTKALCSASVSF